MDDAAVVARIALCGVLHVESADETAVVPRFSGSHRGLPSADALFETNTPVSLKRWIHMFNKESGLTLPAQSG